MSLVEGNRRITLSEMVAARVRESTHNRIRNLSVEEIQGRFVVGGQVSSQHMKQLALHGALELLSGEQFSSNITVHSIEFRPSLDA
jgi:hypothetical protein